jgi:hypothetical protein
VIGFRWLKMYGVDLSVLQQREFRGYSNLVKWYVHWEVPTDEKVKGEFAEISQERAHI